MHYAVWSLSCIYVGQGDEKGSLAEHSRQNVPLAAHIGAPIAFFPIVQGATGHVLRQLLSFCQLSSFPRAHFLGLPLGMLFLHYATRLQACFAFHVSVPKASYTFSGCKHRPWHPCQWSTTLLGCYCADVYWSHPMQTLLHV